MRDHFNKLDTFLISNFQRYGIITVQWSLGIIFLWFGVLKFFPGLSPAEDLVIATTTVMTAGLVNSTILIKIVALWESLIGLGLLTNRFQRVTLFLLWSQMVGAFVPLVLFPREMFTIFPYALTLEGQYIVKNLTLIAGSIILAGNVKHVE